MTCRELAETLIDYVSGELDDEHVEMIRQHLECCPPCTCYLKTYELTITLTRQLPKKDMPERLVQRIKLVIKDEPRPGEASA